MAREEDIDLDEELPTHQQSLYDTATFKFQPDSSVIEATTAAETRLNTRGQGEESKLSVSQSQASINKLGIEQKKANGGRGKATGSAVPSPRNNMFKLTTTEMIPDKLASEGKDLHSREPSISLLPNKKTIFDNWNQNGAGHLEETRE